MKQTDSFQHFFRKQKKQLEKKIGPLTVNNSKFVLLVLCTVLFAWFLFGTLLQDTSNQKRQREIRPVRVQVVESTAQEKTTFYKLQGTLEALNKVTLRSETNGVVKNIVSEKGTKLLKGETILNLAFESRLSKLREAQALVEQRQLEFKNAKKLQTGKFRSKTDVAGAKSQLESAQAALEQIQEDIEDTKIRAPFDGTVDLRHVELGDYVREGDALVEFVSLNPLIGRVNVAERDIHLVKLDAQCLIDCKSDCRTGRVTFISSIADPQTRTYTVEVTVDNPQENIPDGITAEIKIPTETSPAHLFSPSAIAMDDDGRPGVKVVNQNNIVEFHYIDILNHDETGVWVRGLPKHARIVTVGQFFVKTGDTVEPVVIKSKPPEDDLESQDEGSAELDSQSQPLEGEHEAN